MSPWFEQRRTQYYDALLAVSTSGDWSTWVEFFSTGIAESAITTRRRMLALAEVQADLKEHLRATPLRSANARVLIDYAVGHPSFTVGQVATSLGISIPGAKKLIDSLVNHQILAPIDDRVYARRFHAPRVLEVLLDRNEGFASA